MHDGIKKRIEELGRKGELTGMERGELRAYRNTMLDHERHLVDEALGEVADESGPRGAMARGIARGRKLEQERSASYHSEGGQ